jgi:hypothetical protein
MTKNNYDLLYYDFMCLQQCNIIPSHLIINTHYPLPDILQPILTVKNFYILNCFRIHLVNNVKS